MVKWWSVLKLVTYKIKYKVDKDDNEKVSSICEQQIHHVANINKIK